MDKITPLGHIKLISNKIYSVHFPDSHTVVLRLQIWYQGLKRPSSCMTLAHSTRVPQSIHTKLNRINGTRKINLTYNTKTGTRATYHSLHGQLR